MKKPQCRIDRGYDTHVQIYPKEFYSKGTKETDRVVTVVCNIHNNTASKAFKTSYLSNISNVQKIAFEECFDKVTKQCVLSIG